MVKTLAQLAAQASSPGEDPSAFEFVFMGAKVFVKGNEGGEPLKVVKIVDDQQVFVQDDHGQKQKVMIKDLVPATSKTHSQTASTKLKETPMAPTSKKFSALDDSQAEELNQMFDVTSADEELNLAVLEDEDAMTASVKASTQTASDPKKDLAGKVVVMTGRPPKGMHKADVEKLLRARFAIKDVEPAFTSRTDVLLYSMEQKDTGKLKKAEKFGIQCIPYESVLMYGGNQTFDLQRQKGASITAADRAFLAGESEECSDNSAGFQANGLSEFVLEIAPIIENLYEIHSRLTRGSTWFNVIDALGDRGATAAKNVGGGAPEALVKFQRMDEKFQKQVVQAALETLK